MTGRTQTAASELQSTWMIRSVNTLLHGPMRSCEMETPGQPQTARPRTHLAYQPLLPCGNKYLQQKWDKTSYDLHRRKVKSAKPNISMVPPKTYSHLTLRLKKLKLEEEWTTKIQRENNMLMDKISHIKRTTGGVDNRNYYVKKSLGKEKRQLELLRITKENQMILVRLSQCRPHYNARSWHEDWLKTRKVMDIIARYPQGRGQENPIKNHSECEKAQKVNADATTRSLVRNQASDKAESEENEKREETNKEEGTATEVQQDMSTPCLPEP